MRSQLQILRARATLHEAIHSFFRQRDFLSIDAPIAVTSPGTEVHLGYFSTTWVDHQAKSHPLFLRSSPELHLKQALSWNLDRIYHLGKCFRNRGELSPWHHPEFTLLEWYQTGISLPHFMSQTEELVRYAAETLAAASAEVMPLPAQFQRLSVFEAFEQWAKISLVDGDPDLAAQGRAQGYISLQPTDSFETAYFKILLDVIEPRLKAEKAIFLYDYPASQCALARIEGGRAQRFELYLEGVELCNAFDELLGSAENRQRIKKSNEERRALNYPFVPEDEDFFRALDRGLKPCCGNALGFDRLLALLLGEKSIHRVVPFRENRPFAGSQSLGGPSIQG